MGICSSTSLHLQVRGCNGAQEESKHHDYDAAALGRANRQGAHGQAVAAASAHAAVVADIAVVVASGMAAVVVAHVGRALRNSVSRKCPR